MQQTFCVVYRNWEWQPILTVAVLSRAKIIDQYLTMNERAA